MVQTRQIFFYFQIFFEKRKFLWIFWRSCFCMSDTMDQFQSICFGCKQLLCVQCKRELCLQCRRVGCALCIDPARGCYICSKQDEQKNVIRNGSLHRTHLIKEAKILLDRMWEERNQWMDSYTKSRELHGNGFMLRSEHDTYIVCNTEAFQHASTVCFAVEIYDLLKAKHICCQVKVADGGRTM